MFLHVAVIKLTLTLMLKVCATAVVYKFLSFAKLGQPIELILLSSVITIFLFSSYNPSKNVVLITK